MTRERVTRDNLGAWLVKARPDRGHVRGAEVGRVLESRCVSANYRSALMRTGDRVVLWLSGPTGAEPRPGIWGIGEVRGPVTDGIDGPQVAVHLPVADGVLLTREELRAHPLLCGIEVLAMPAGSNPSWLSRPEWEAMRALLPG